MDRNTSWRVNKKAARRVALRKESVDRNSCLVFRGAGACVALRKESVDRNLYSPYLLFGGVLSLSARRAWIEIRYDVSLIYDVSLVALRKESVDRNSAYVNVSQRQFWSLSARRAWIEIHFGTPRR